jgi:hypothetical protein
MPSREKKKARKGGRKISDLFPVVCEPGIGLKWKNLAGDTDSDSG